MRRSAVPRERAPPGPSAAAGCARLRLARSGSAALRPAAHLRREGWLSLAAGPCAATPPVSPPVPASHPFVLSPQQSTAVAAKSSGRRRRGLMAGAVSWSLRVLAVPPRCPHCFYSLGTVAAWGFPGCGVGPGRGSCSTRFGRSRAGGGRESSALVPPLSAAGRDGATRPFPPSPNSNGFCLQRGDAHRSLSQLLFCKLSAPLLCTERSFFVFIMVNAYSSQCILQQQKKFSVIL